MRPVVLIVLVLFCACGQRQRGTSQLTVAAAANLTDVCAKLGAAFEAKTGTQVVFSYGSTAQLTHQIENGAPFDLFASADTQHVDLLIQAGKLTHASRAIYALGQLALWSPNGAVRTMNDLKSVRFIAIAQPDSAPYGKASIECLQHFGLWEALKPKVVYTNSISQAKQLASSGNADAAFTAYSLVYAEAGSVLRMDRASYQALEQALGIASTSTHTAEAVAFRAFLLGSEGRAIWARNGYLLP